jgi:hypothetical protein
MLTGRKKLKKLKVRKNKHKIRHNFHKNYDDLLYTAHFSSESNLDLTTPKDF